VDFVLAHAAIPAGGRLLDVGCGPGRHSLELVRRGYRVLGIDPSAAMLAVARQGASGIIPPPKFRQARAQVFQLSDDEPPFDAAICLFTSLGQIDEQGENTSLVYNVFEALRPGAKFIIEVPQRKWVLKNLETSQRFGTDTHYTDIQRVLDTQGKSVSETFTVVSLGEQKTFLLRYRLFERETLNALLENAGFQVPMIYGGYDASVLTPESPIMLAIARKPLLASGRD
jgi:D-alanine-D-alanine ligase